MSDVREARRRHRGWVGVASGILIAGVVAGGTAAFAAIPSTTTKAITGCVNKTTGLLRVVDVQAGKKCVKSEKAIAWSAGYSYRGAWAAGTAYASQDVVVAAGASYVARGASKGTAPATTPASWGLLAAAGAPGAPGPKGDPGAPGLTGAPGAPGSARAWAFVSAAGSVTRQSGTVAVTRTGPGVYCVAVSGVDPATTMAMVAPEYQGDSTSISGIGHVSHVEYDSTNCSATQFRILGFDVTNGTSVASSDEAFVILIP